MAGGKQEADGPWHRQSRIAIGRALLRTHPAPMSATEIASATGKDPSNTKKIADELVEAGGLKHLEPKSSEGRAGRRTQRVFAFADGEQDRFVASFGEDRPAGLSPGQQLVFVDASALGGDLLHSLARPELVARAAWSALCDGERQELAIAFDGPAAVDASLDLMAALSAAKVKATRASVSKVDTPGELHRWLNRVRSITQ
jgi:hypothetical protein